MIAGIVPAGGAGRRMGGVDKAALRVGGITILDRVLGAARPVCDRLVVVGPIRSTAFPDVKFLVEAEPGGGPVPAVIAGLAATGDGCEVVLVVAGDLPLLAPGHLRRLIGALDGSGPEVEAAAAAGAGGRPPNPLLAAYRRRALGARCRRLGAGDPAWRLTAGPTVVVDLGGATLNVNRPADLAEAEIALSRNEEESR